MRVEEVKVLESQHFDKYGSPKQAEKYFKLSINKTFHLEHSAVQCLVEHREIDFDLSVSTLIYHSPF